WRGSALVSLVYNLGRLQRTHNQVRYGNAGFRRVLSENALRNRSIASIQQVFDRVRQILHVPDQPVRLKVGNRYVGIAERDPYYWDAGPPRGPDIGSGIADHDRGRGMAAGPGNGLVQDSRVGLGHPEGVRAADRREAGGQAQPFEQQLR